MMLFYLFKLFCHFQKMGNDIQGAIMAVGASKPTVVADADGFFSVKSKMLVNFVPVSLQSY